MNIYKSYSKSGKPLTGFTLIELIVSMAVFLIVIGVSITIFISIIQNQRKVLAEQELLNQISYVEEYMSKALRMAKRDEDGSCLGSDKDGYVYLLTRPDAESGFYRGIKFINQSDNDSCQEFFLENLVSEDVNTPLVLKELKDSDAVPLTSEKLQINSMRFGINGGDGCYGAGCLDGAFYDETNPIQPRVTILLSTNVLTTDKEPVKIIQTTVSQRNLNAK
jgi:prepilin-type N-terminal cleavage/methylation domain-containing protein